MLSYQNFPFAVCLILLVRHVGNQKEFKGDTWMIQLKCKAPEKKSSHASFIFSYLLIVGHDGAIIIFIKTTYLADGAQ